LLNMVQKYRVYKELDNDFDTDASFVELELRCLFM